MEAKTNNFLHPGIEVLKRKKSLKKLGYLHSSYFRTLQLVIVVMIVILQSL